MIRIIHEIYKKQVWLEKVLLTKHTVGTCCTWLPSIGDLSQMNYIPGVDHLSCLSEVARNLTIKPHVDGFIYCDPGVPAKSRDT